MHPRWIETWLREVDSNHRPSRYERDALTGLRYPAKMASPPERLSRGEALAFYLSHRLASPLLYHRSGEGSDLTKPGIAPGGSSPDMGPVPYFRAPGPSLGVYLVRNPGEPGTRN